MTRFFLENEFRLETMFRNGTTVNLAIAASSSNLTVDAMTQGALRVMATHCSIVEEQFFKLPKLFLFPGILIADPMLGVTILPVRLCDTRLPLRTLRNEYLGLQ